MSPENEQWQKLMFEQMRGLNETVEKLRDEVTNIRVGMASLKTDVRNKSSLWGVLGGGLPVVIGLGIWFIQHLIAK